MPLESVLPDYDQRELDPLRVTIGDARVVVFGTATRGTRPHRFHGRRGVDAQGYVLPRELGDGYVTSGYSFFEGTATVAWGVTFETPGTAWLAGPRAVLQIPGGVFIQNPADHHVGDVRMAERFDVVIYFTTTAATERHPFRFPTAF